MIYSSSIFLNELDLLDLKIAEESPYMDKIYITESPLTFVGNQKPLNFPVEKYEKNDKVVYVVIPKEAFNNCKTPWDREFLQRNYVQTIIPYNDDDIWFVTDLDEILCGDKIPHLIAEVSRHKFIAIHMKSCCYYLNMEITSGVWEPPFAAVGSVCKRHSFQSLRNRIVSVSSAVVWWCGKHFNSFGGPEALEYKLKNFSHTECATPESIIFHINNYNTILQNPHVKMVEIDESYPKTILNNMDKWEKHMKR
jgi:beta-1,4-mannosyl-glycoprotein beta-1,4-N-acetylglucosaminyltransferase